MIQYVYYLDLYDHLFAAWTTMESFINVVRPDFYIMSHTTYPIFGHAIEPSLAPYWHDAFRIIEAHAYSFQLIPGVHDIAALNDWLDRTATLLVSDPPLSQHNLIHTFQRIYEKHPISFEWCDLMDHIRHLIARIVTSTRVTVKLNASELPSNSGWWNWCLVVGGSDRSPVYHWRYSVSPPFSQMYDHPFSAGNL
jgi:hypothetical protein